MSKEVIADKLREEGAAIIECAALIRTGNIKHVDAQQVLAASVELLTYVQKLLRQTP